MRVGVIGASGYTGLELLKILINHPKFELTYVANSSGEMRVSELHPSLTKVIEMDVEKVDAKEVSKHCDIAFLALPHKTAMSFSKELLALDVKVIDLSADYRLELEAYEKFYCEHEDKENLAHAVYGLPEYFKDDIKNARLIANPGCYPTATLLGLLPFIDYIDESNPVFIDAKSGLSGAGKNLTDISHFANINENSLAYNPFKHRHSPEIIEKVRKVKNKNLHINFVPHLLPLTRGMLVSIYATLKSDIEPLDVLNSAYSSSRFIRIRKNPVDIKSTAGTNFCDIFATKNSNALFVSSSIDNLLRGASSQAVVNANIICGFEEDLGIPTIAYVP